MSGKSILIIGEDPALVDFDAPDAPKNMSAEKVMAGLNGSVDRLTATGHHAGLLLITDQGPVEDQVTGALSKQNYNIIVVGAGLRTLPPMADNFERVMNALHENASGAKLAFNTGPDDSDAAALRWL